MTTARARDSRSCCSQVFGLLSSAFRSSAFRSSAFRSSAFRSSAFRSSAFRSSAAIGLGFLLSASACSSNEKKDETPVDPNASPILDGTTGEIFNPDETGSDGADQFCAGQEAGTELAPSIIELLVDTSLSMDETAPGSRRSKWLETRQAMLGAIDVMPGTASLGVVFYPDVEVGEMPCFDSQADVAIQSLGATSSAQRSQIRDAFGKESPRGSTPTHDAYRYALAQVAAATQPGQRYLVLITDGTPTYALGCKGSGQQQDPADPTPLIPEAASALGRGIKTFVIGSPGSEDARKSLSQMAEAGGTAKPGCSHNGPNYCHFDMTQQPDFAASLRDALASISGLALSCAYDVPPPPSGSTLDPGKVNVLFTPDGGEREVLLRGTDSSCKEGWQYSPNGKQIVLCGDTCDRVRSSSGDITLQFGCATQVIGPR